MMHFWVQALPHTRMASYALAVLRGSAPDWRHLHSPDG
jgi:hypothetical protein